MAPERLAEIERIGPEDAPAWRDAIERQYRSGRNVAFDSCISALLGAATPPGDLSSAAGAVAASFRPVGRPCLYLDVSTIAGHDAGTGIQRVVRETVRQLGLMEDLPCRMEPVRDTGEAVYLARGFGARLFGLPEPDGTDRLAEIGEDDVFLGLDLNMHDLSGLLRTIRSARQNGGRAVVVIYDLLPIQMPACFPEPVQKLFPVWLDTIARHADGLLCISRTVADDLLALLDSRPPARRTPLSVGWFHLGSDFFVSSDRHRALPRAENQIRHSTELRPSLLMVGTVEPRKGHALALEAVQSLWAADVDIGLTIVGKAGWLMEGLVEQFRTHPEAGRRLNWIEQASDSLVTELYRAAGALLMASEGEGFGLPIVEAARAGLAVIARDIPVFREIAGEHALYFPPGGPAALADTIRRWLDLRKDGCVPDPTQIRTQSWAQASRQLARVVIDGDWYATWTPQRQSSDQAESAILSRSRRLPAAAVLPEIQARARRPGTRRRWAHLATGNMRPMRGVKRIRVHSEERSRPIYAQRDNADQIDCGAAGGQSVLRIQGAVEIPPERVRRRLARCTTTSGRDWNRSTTRCGSASRRRRTRPLPSCAPGSRASTALQSAIRHRQLARHGHALGWSACAVTVERRDR